MALYTNPNPAKREAEFRFLQTLSRRLVRHPTLRYIAIAEFVVLTPVSFLAELLPSWSELKHSEHLIWHWWRIENDNGVEGRKAVAVSQREGEDALEVIESEAYKDVAEVDGA